MKDRNEMQRTDTLNNSSSKMNSKLLFLPLRELQEYMNGLELENERLRGELSTVSRLNCILENVRRSSNKGFTAMQCIDRNKCCRCNEHLNGHLRRMAQEADIELRVWQEQYDKLIKKGCVVDDGNKVNGFSRLADMPMNASKQDVIQVDDDSIGEKSPKRLKQYLSSNDSRQHKCTNGCKMCSRGYVSDGANHVTEPLVVNQTTKEYGPPMLKHNSNSNDSNSSSQYISIPIANEVVSDTDSDLPSATSPSSSRYDSSPPLVMYDSTDKSCPLMCEWPNCRKQFTTEDDLVRHRRNHIRKSIYHCEYCSARILNKEDLDNHMITNHSKPINVESAKEANISSGHSHSSHDDNSSVIEISSDKSLDLTIDSEHSKQNSANGEKPLYFPRQTPMHDRLDASNGAVEGHARSAANSKPEDYKRTRYSGIGRYRCPWPDCGYTPHFLRDLRRHMHKHTGDKKHKCDYPGCDFVSVWKTSLLQHQRKKHFAAIPQSDLYS